jgi:hypothetical protein
MDFGGLRGAVYFGLLWYTVGNAKKLGPELRLDRFKRL